MDHSLMQNSGYTMQISHEHVQSDAKSRVVGRFGQFKIGWKPMRVLQSLWQTKIVRFS